MCLLKDSQPKLVKNDYLLKPIGYGDFLKASEKAMERIGV